MNVLLHRGLLLLPLLWMVSTLVFALAQVLPGDPVEMIAGENASLEQRDEVLRAYHLHLPVFWNPWPFRSPAALRQVLEQSLEAGPPGEEARRALLAAAAAAPALVARLHAQLARHSSPASPPTRLQARLLEVLGPKTAGSGDPPLLQHRSRLAATLTQTRYVHFLREILTGRFISYHNRQPVREILAERLPYTLLLAAASLCLAMLVGIPLGTWSAARAGKPLDHATRGLAMLAISLPSFWLGPLLILLFSVTLGWLPVSGASGARSLVLPALTLGLGMSGMLLRVTRAAVLEVLPSDHLRSARARGASPSRVLFLHGLRTALLPVVTVLGLQLGALLSGAVITEEIFGWPGLGRELVTAIRTRDLPLLQGCVLAVTCAYLLVNTATDLLYARLDPRVRLEGGLR